LGRQSGSCCIVSLRFSLEGNTRRAIDIHEGDKLDEKALKALIRAAVALNKSSARG